MTEFAQQEPDLTPSKAKTPIIAKLLFGLVAASAIFCFGVLLVDHLAAPNVDPAPAAAGAASASQSAGLALDAKDQAVVDAYRLHHPKDAPELANCSEAASARACEVEQLGFARSTWPRADKGDIVQARNLADCLSDGCSGAVEINQIAGCAWALSINLSGSAAVQDIDARHVHALCDELDPAAKEAAVSRSVLMGAARHFYRADDD